MSLYSLGNLSKTCTEDGWTSISIDSYIIDCGYNPNNTIDENTVRKSCLQTLSVPSYYCRWGLMLNDELSV